MAILRSSTLSNKCRPNILWDLLDLQTSVPIADVKWHQTQSHARDVVDNSREALKLDEAIPD